MTPAGPEPNQQPPPRRGFTRLPEHPDITSISTGSSDTPSSPQVAHPAGAPTGLDTPQRCDGIEREDDSRGEEAPDAFETSHAAENLEDSVELTRASIDLDDLPIELITLTDGFIETLTAKVHATPPSIDRLSQLFQDFYALASSHVATHIDALASRQSRNHADAGADASARSSPSSFSPAASRLRSRKSSRAAKDEPRLARSASEQQMITAEQLADRKRARKALEAKRNSLEEAVERRLCEGIYHRIHRHRSTHDEAQDDKLRSKTAALALVGIGLAELGVDTISEPSQEAPPSADHQTDDLRQWLAQARADLSAMAESRYPLGKLGHLKAAHKSIVDTLAHFHPSASADEIMPMLIYTLITMPPEKVHIISDLHFIQNFRWQPKLTGEAAYCLTNLEAAISFLQTVDLATLRADEQPSGPAKGAGQPDARKAETFPPAYPQGLVEAPPTSASSLVSKENAAASKPAPSPAGLMATNVLRNRGLSDLVNTPAQAFGAASGAVFSTADQGLKTISTSLGDSYSFLLGKLRERQQGRSESVIAVPRTLDDARKLVSTPPPEDEDGASTTAAAENTLPHKRPPHRDDRVLSMIGGRRDVGADSTPVGHQGAAAAAAAQAKRVVAAEERKTSAPSAPAAQSPAMLEQVRNFGSSFNPMARLSSIGMMRGFGRSLTTPASSATGTAPATSTTKDELAKTSDGGDLASAFPDIAAALPPKQIVRVAPPRRRFMEMQNPGDLRLGEVLDLLRDYRRLAGALKDLGAFDEEK